MHLSAGQAYLTEQKLRRADQDALADVISEARHQLGDVSIVEFDAQKNPWFFRKLVRHEEFHRQQHRLGPRHVDAERLLSHPYMAAAP